MTQSGVGVGTEVVSRGSSLSPETPQRSNVPQIRSDRWEMKEGSRQCSDERTVCTGLWDAEQDVSFGASRWT